jgi:hypothetical protein
MRATDNSTKAKFGDDLFCECESYRGDKVDYTGKDVE